jgi:hypothetical protein
MSNNKSYLVVIDNIDPKVVFPNTPWQICTHGYRFHSYELKKNEPAILLSNYLITAKEDNKMTVEQYVATATDNIFKSLYELNHLMEGGQGQPQVFTVHSRNLLCRMVDRWAKLRNVNFNILRTANFTDVVELLNYPAILTAEERMSFNYTRLGITTNQPVPEDPVELLIQTCQIFLQ